MASMESSVNFRAEKARKRLMPLAFRQWHLYRFDFMVDPKKIELKTADVTIKVSPDRSDLIQTKILNGVKYILVRVEEGVEVNGVPVQITE